MNPLLDPAVLFFVFGVVAGLVRSNLEIPPAIARFLSLYLLMSLGLKGGFALAHAGLSGAIAGSLGAAVLLAITVPLIGWALLSRVVGRFDALAVAATYGSVSAVTFVTAVQHLEAAGMSPGGHMAAAMALMESPAIVFAVLMANVLRQRGAAATGDATGGVIALGEGPGAGPIPLGKVLHESLTDGAQLLLLGAMLVGVLTGDAGKAALQPFAGDLFKGMLSFFLLEMGLQTARSLPALRGTSRALLAYAVLAPPIHAALALALAVLLRQPAGDAALLMVLAASASYIAVPAALRFAIPEARPSLYLGLSLGITFPLNLMFGIPTYAAIARAVLG